MKRRDKDVRPRMKAKPSQRRAKAPVPSRDDMLLLAVNAVPDTWLDSLLTGPESVIGPPPYGCPEIENLCKAIRARIRSTLSERSTSSENP